MVTAMVLKIQQKIIHPLAKGKAAVASEVLQFVLFILVNQCLSSLELQPGMCKQQNFHCNSLKHIFGSRGRISLSKRWNGILPCECGEALEQVS